MTPLTEQIDELKRELCVRRNCYPRWVQEGKLAASEALRRLTRLADAHRSLLMLHSLVHACTAGTPHVEQLPLIPAAPDPEESARD